MRLAQRPAATIDGHCGQFQRSGVDPLVITGALLREAPAGEDITLAACVTPFTET